VPPGDTAEVISLMRRTMQQIDAGLVTMQRRDTTIQAVTDSAPRYVTLWLEDHVPRKLVISDSAATTGLVAQTAIWFVGGDVSVVQQPFDLYAFDSGRIVLWTDDGMMPRTDISESARMARETQILDSARVWLKTFGVGLP
jgi:hypothetical protein